MTWNVVHPEEEDQYQGGVPSNFAGPDPDSANFDQEVFEAQVAAMPAGAEDAWIEYLIDQFMERETEAEEAERREQADGELRTALEEAQQRTHLRDVLEGADL